MLAGGGLTGAIYQVGVLRALDDVLLNRSVLDFDLYVGTSGGAFIAAMLAVGIPPQIVAETVRNPSLGLQWKLLRHMFAPNFKEVGSRLWNLPGKVPAMAQDLLAHRGSFLISDLVAFASLALPSGLLDSDQLSALMREILELAGLPTSFKHLRRELVVVATELDTWKRVEFSKDSKPPVSIPQAVAASAAIPILFKPVRINGADFIDGGAKGAAAIDVAIDRGAELIIVVNPLVPVDPRTGKRPAQLERLGRRLSDMGIRAIGNQLIRGMISDGLAEHLTVLHQTHPEVDIVLIQPRPDDEKMFMHEVMSTSARLVVAQHGYESVLNGISRDYGHFQRVLARHQIELSPGIIEGRPWEVPMRSYDDGDLAKRLDKTVFRARHQKKSKQAKRFAGVMDRIEARLDVHSGVPKSKAGHRKPKAKVAK